MKKIVIGLITLASASSFASSVFVVCGTQRESTPVIDLRFSGDLAENSKRVTGTIYDADACSINSRGERKCGKEVKISYLPFGTLNTDKDVSISYSGIKGKQGENLEIISGRSAISGIVERSISKERKLVTSIDLSFYHNNAILYETTKEEYVSPALVQKFMPAKLILKGAGEAEGKLITQSGKIIKVNCVMHGNL